MEIFYSLFLNLFDSFCICPFDALDIFELRCMFLCVVALLYAIFAFGLCKIPIRTNMFVSLRIILYFLEIRGVVVALCSKLHFPFLFYICLLFRC